MFDVSWGETFVLIGISVAAIGRKDLPKASRFFGKKVGQLVGIMQGARARADNFAQQNELHALQNELRSGLRELDTVKGELAVAASSQGLIGRGLGSTIPSRKSTVNQSNMNVGASQLSQPMMGIKSNPEGVSATNGTSITGGDYLDAARMMSETTQKIEPSSLELAPRSQSVAAVAEEQWEKTGIGFKTKAEKGTGFWNAPISSASGQVIGGGSSLLADLLQQNLIHDQYDRAVMEQDQELQAKMERAEAEAKSRSKEKK